MHRTMLRSSLLVLLVACKGRSTTTSDPAPARPVPAPVPAAAKGPALDPATFDRSCTAATDCVVVKPATCDPCGCPTDAIASKAMARFDEAASKLACPAPDLMVKCQPCTPRVAACEHGGCVAAAAP